MSRRAAIQRIDEMTEPPIFGRWYLVPTLLYRWCGRAGEWPIIGPKHQDAEIIGFRDLHFHVDGRFLSARQLAIAAKYSHYNSAAITAAGYPLCSKKFDEKLVNEAHPAPIYKRLRCTSRAFPYALPYYQTGTGAWPEELRKAFADERLIAGPHGWICPHRAAHMGSIAPDENGIITCPLHGLRWKAATGEAA